MDTTRDDDDSVGLGSGVPIVRKLTRPPLLDLSSTGGPSVPFCARGRNNAARRIEEDGSTAVASAALSRRGRSRAQREDCYALHPYLARLPCGVALSLFGVFDGHGGANAARYSASRLPLLFASFLEDDASSALRSAFLTTHGELVGRAAPPALVRSWTAPVRAPTGSTASEGTTATAVVIGGGAIVIAHSGDSRALLVDGNGKTRRLCDDHRATRADEAARICDAGGLVLHVGGAVRVNGVMAVTRALGHADFTGLVIPDPEISRIELQGNERFVVIASDGVWDHVSDEECARVVGDLLLKQDGEDVVKDAAFALVQVAWDGGGGDDITSLVVDLGRHDAGAALRNDSMSFGDEEATDGKEKEVAQNCNSVGDHV